MPHCSQKLCRDVWACRVPMPRRKDARTSKYCIGEKRKVDMVNARWQRDKKGVNEWRCNGNCADCMQRGVKGNVR